jgi:Flp pilus assembly pilin Flp
MRHHHSTTTRQRARRGERGASLVEYALLLSLIALVAFGAVSFFGGQNNAGFGRSADCIKVAYEGTLGDDCPEPTP